MAKHKLDNQPFTKASKEEQEHLKSVPRKVPTSQYWRTKIRATSSVIESFYHAFNGIILGLRTERNVRIHLAMAILVAALAVVLKVDQTGCLALGLAIGLVLAVEFLNTSIEHLVDLASARSYHVSAKAAKDTAAAAVLMASLCALFIGVIVLGPKLLELGGKLIK